MPESDPGVRRVCIHAGVDRVDLAVPAAMPVATLIPAVVDILAAADHRSPNPPAAPAATRYQLARPGVAPLDPSTTLAQNDIRDGTLLVLTCSSTEPTPAPAVDDTAEAMSTTLGAVTRSWTPNATRLTGAATAGWLACTGFVVLMRNMFVTSSSRHLFLTAGVAAVLSCVTWSASVLSYRAYRDKAVTLTLGLLGVGFSAVAGFFTVPGGPAAPNLLLAATAAAVTSVLTVLVTGCSAPCFASIACVAVVVAVGSVAAVTTAVPLTVLSSAAAVASLGLLEASARVSIVAAGLSPWPDLDADSAVPAADCLAAKAVRADSWLTTLTGAFCWTAGAGAVATAVGVHGSGAPRLGSVVFAIVVGAVLLLRARAQANTRRRVLLLSSAIATSSAAWVVAATAWPSYAPWIAAAPIMLAGAALFLGFTAPTIAFSPVARFRVDLLEYLLWAAAIPLACWISGLYGTVRHLNLT
ncbi:type VII secretion integral membrane protein EccD [Mycobacterium botniense]|uniref:ESX-4 secretion system protein eccD4 n=1 Tax=Mycobacterium botniense TaxID=84962 RepID=A0A7I9XST5_9MYCO|nr:type VII secretion integral membrane protein EccD [Mycobacterium botniense]GFG73055.1 ESX-4 secretion system protein eccD4 [Mycobacterium botniense]